MKDRISRRGILLGAGAILAAPALVGRALAEPTGGDPQELVRRNIMSFYGQDWRDHFQTLRRGAILCDTRSRALHYWSADGETHLVYPTSVPMAEHFTRRGYTEITLMRRNPVWIPTPNMRERDPSLPARVEAGPQNPMGTRAMNLTWQYYRIHGIDDVAKIGRQASNGCIGLFNHHVETLFELVGVGTQVRVI